MFEILLPLKPILNSFTVKSNSPQWRAVILLDPNSIESSLVNSGIWTGTYVSRFLNKLRPVNLDVRPFEIIPSSIVLTWPSFNDFKSQFIEKVSVPVSRQLHGKYKLDPGQFTEAFCWPLIKSVPNSNRNPTVTFLKMKMLIN